MSEKQSPVNKAKTFLMQYSAAKAMRRQLMEIGPQAPQVHAAQIAECERVMREIVSMISRLENGKQSEIMMMRYVNCWSWRRIVINMEQKGYSESLCFAMHGRALQHINRMMEEYGNED